MSSETTPQVAARVAAHDVAATFCATLIDEWIHHGARHAVIAPGSRSTPLALALAARPELNIHVFHDERSASFAALGIGLLGMPAILLCTSGTAAAHFHAAVIEAHQSAVPMLVCTADRPPELRDVGAPQTIDQIKLYGSSVRWFHDPGVASVDAAPAWRSLAAHAFWAATASWPGPVHLNLPFREPLVGTTAELPPRTSNGGAADSADLAITAHTEVTAQRRLNDAQIAKLVGVMKGRRGVIVAGRGCGSADAVSALAAALGWPVIADARSGVRHRTDVAVAAADHLLRSPEFATANVPAVVLRIGEPPASKVVAQWLAASNAHQIHVSSVPAWIDPEGHVAQHVLAEPDDFCSQLSDAVASTDPMWLRTWIAAEGLAQQRLADALGDDELSEPLVARVLGSLLPSGAHLVVSSSMPIRDVEWFGIIADGVTVHSNRGANGIDGVIATATGIALATGAPTAVLIGDVALLHDSSSLTGLMRRDIDLRIVLVDNDGGGIFSFLPQASSLTAARFEQLFGTPHGVDLAVLATAHGIPVRAAVDSASLTATVTQPGPALIHVKSDRAQNVRVHERLNALASGHHD